MTFVLFLGHQEGGSWSLGEKNLVSGGRFWSSKKEDSAVDRSIEKILSAVTNLPLRYWKPHMFFTGARDIELASLTQGHFPVKQIKRKTHPIFSLEQLPLNTGFRVCPCSSKVPFQQKRFRFIRKGCRLLHTGHLMDRDSYLIEKVIFNIPSSVAFRLRFRGEVPEECVNYKES